MKVVAVKHGSRYLIMVGDDPETADAIKVNTEDNTRFPPRSLQSYFVMEGYWEECEHSDELLQRLLAVPEVAK